MEDLNFYTVDLKYVNFLKESEINKRGKSCVPDMDYTNKGKPKFLCGIVLEINDLNYYVPVSSYTKKQHDNFLIKIDKGRKISSSLRFNYMFPVPGELLKERRISTEPDRHYRNILSQELRHCIKYQDIIRAQAERTYRRVIEGKNPVLKENSCDFVLLEEKCREYLTPQKASLDHSIKETQTNIAKKKYITNNKTLIQTPPVR